MYRRTATLLCALSLSACGSLSDDFVGEYDSVTTGTLTFNGETTASDPESGTLVIIAGKGKDTVVVQDPDCDLGAVVTSDTTFEFIATYCPPKQVGDCEITMNVAEGGGTLNGDKLVIEASGTNSAVCEEGTSSSSFTLKIEGTKKP